MISLISSASLAAVQSPRMQMNSRIASAASTGEISAADQTALSTALDSIGQSLSSSTGKSIAKGGMKQKIDTLIDNQVDGGTLTTDQVSELKAFFAQGPGGAQPGNTGSDDTGASDSHDTTATASRGPGGPRGPGGSPPPPPSGDDESDSDSSTGSSTATASADLNDQLKALETMLDNLRKSLTSSATNIYGSSSSSTAQTGLVYRSVA